MTYKIVSDIACTRQQNNPTDDWRGLQETFVSLIKWLDTLSSIGVTRIASYYGQAQGSGLGTSLAGYSSLTGTAFDYWDRSANCGTNAWALYCWGSAGTPFYMLIQWGAPNISGTGVSTPMFGDAGGLGSISDKVGAIGVMFALRANGTSPWNGTTNNNGADTKGNPIWIPTSNAVQNLYVFPRTNSTRGTYFSTKSYFAQFYQYANTTTAGFAYRSRVHAIADENNICLINDIQSTMAPDVTYFGKFTPINDMYYQTTGSYWMFSSNADPVTTNNGTSTIWGNPIQATANIANEGGIQHPSPSSGTIGFSWDTPAPNYFTAYTYMANPPGAFGPYNLSGSLVGTNEEYPFVLFMNESSVSGTYGLVGTSGANDFLRLMTCLPSYTTFNGKTRIGWSFKTYNQYTGITTPWLPSANPLMGVSREGNYW